MNPTLRIARKLFSTLLLTLTILLAGCSGAVVPAAAIPAEATISREPSSILGSQPNAQTSEPDTAPASLPLSDSAALTPAPASPAADGSVSPSSTDTQGTLAPLPLSGVEEPVSMPSAGLQGSPAPTPSPGPQSSGLSSAAPDTTALMPAGFAAPTITAMPTNAPEAKKKPDAPVYPINTFKSDSVLCLTFDDGGNKKAVQKALAVLEEYDIDCTFFVIGKYLKSHAELWKQAVEQGHQICNHTQNHKWLSELSNEEAKKEILAWEASAAEVLGEEYVTRMKKEFPYIRLPGGAGSKSKRLMGLLSELGYTPVGWSIESYYAVLRKHDLKKDPLSEIADNVSAHIVKKASAGSIILLHFNPYDTTRLDAILEGILAKELDMSLLSDHDL